MPLIIDTDPGNGIPGANTDDGLAIALAAASPSVDLMGLSIVSGNTPRSEGLASADWLVDRLGLDIPVMCGLPYRDQPRVRDWIEQAQAKRDSSLARSLWGPAPFESATAERCGDGAVDWMAEAVLSNPGKVTIAAIGPQSNVAAMLRTYPETAQAVERIVIMGGAFDRSQFSVDTNFLLDPHAAAAVVSSGAAVTLMPMDVTTRTLMTHEDLDDIEGFQNSLTQALVPTLRPWLSFSAATRDIPGMWIHDALTIAALIAPGVVESSEARVGVQIDDSDESGRTHLLGSEAASDQVGIRHTGVVEVVTDVDSGRLVALIKDQFRQWAAPDGYFFRNSSRIASRLNLMRSSSCVMTPSDPTTTAAAHRGAVRSG